MSQLPTNCSTEFFSKHFKKSEIFSDVVDLPTGLRSFQIFQNLFQVTLFLESFRWFINNVYFVDDLFLDKSNKPIVISSGFRTEAHNKLVGGVPNSLHCVGLAVDFSIPGMSSSQIIDAIKKFFNDINSCYYDNSVIIDFINYNFLLYPDYFGDINGKYVHIEFKYKVNYGY